MLEACCSLLQDDNGEYASGTPILGDVLTVSKTRVYNIILMKWLHFTWVGSLLYQYSNYLSQILELGTMHLKILQLHSHIILKNRGGATFFAKYYIFPLNILAFFFFLNNLQHGNGNSCG